MRRNRTILEKPQINMTPMIDVVFLLLTFFVLTFRIIVPDGDFNVKMSPTEQMQPAAADTDSVQVRLIADADGSLSAIQLNGENVSNFDLLRQRVSAISLANLDLEVVLLFDEHLRYEYVIRAVTAVNGELRDGQIRKICDNIKFARQGKE
jgi:biopolymer transport protein ExbD